MARNLLGLAEHAGRKPSNLPRRTPLLIAGPGSEIDCRNWDFGQTVRSVWRNHRGSAWRTQPAFAIEGGPAEEIDDQPDVIYGVDL